MTDQAKPVSRTWRRFLRFSVRGLIVLVLVSGIGLGWAVQIVRDARNQRDAVAAIHEAGGGVRYDWESGKIRFVPPHPPGWPRWLVSRLGIDYFGHVVSVDLDGHGSDEVLIDVGRLDRVLALRLSGSPVTDAGLTHIRNMRSLVMLCLDDTDVTDAGVADLKALRNLTGLCLDRTDVTDRGLAHLTQLNQLVALSLNDTAVSGQGLVQLAELPWLSGLRLDGSQATSANMIYLQRLPALAFLSIEDTTIDDVGIRYLTGLTRLGHIGLRGTSVTTNGAQELSKALPNADIHVDFSGKWSDPRGIKEHGSLHPWDWESGTSHCYPSRRSGNAPKRWPAR